MTAFLPKKMKIVTVVGARPQFIKAAAVSRVMGSHEEIIVHTGQHYDDNMSKVFFEELCIPLPKYNLGIGSDTHARQTGRMMMAIEDVLLKETPDLVLLYGDTNSTMAASITAAKLNIPIAHVEAGLRSNCMAIPEEQNRLVTDHLSKWLFTPSQFGSDCLAREGITKNVHMVGDVMYDAMLYYGKQIEGVDPQMFYDAVIPISPNNLNLSGGYYLATIHRPDNTDQIENLKGILDGFNGLDKPVLFPMHPRTRAAAEKMGVKLEDYSNVLFAKPLSYVYMIYFAKNAEKILTDSGGLHKECYLWKKSGVLIFHTSPWIETLNGNWNVIAKPIKEDILDKVYNTKVDKDTWAPYYGDGHASEKIIKILENFTRIPAHA